jgi:hypothetical protein
MESIVMSTLVTSGLLCLAYGILVMKAKVK